MCSLITGMAMAYRSQFCPGTPTPVLVLPPLVFLETIRIQERPCPQRVCSRCRPRPNASQGKPECSRILIPGLSPAASHGARGGSLSNLQMTKRPASSIQGHMASSGFSRTLGVGKGLENPSSSNKHVHAHFT